MKRQNVLKVLFLSLIVSSFASSCGLVDKWKTPEQPTDSQTTDSPATESTAQSETDDLFSKTMAETSSEAPLNAGSDAPSNIQNDVKDDLKSLEDEFASGSEIQKVKVEEALPEIKEELQPVISDNSNMDAGKVLNYKVQKGETLMQIAFKIYGDISKWKNIKQMNNSTLGSNTALRSGMQLKYTAPAKNFVWNPEGSPHMIKNGETLGTISNSVYQTPKKWKSLWENNKPLIKNPNVIYAGFTLYYKGGAMANYVQPKAEQKKIVEKSETEIEEIKVDRAISNMEQVEATHEAEIDLTKEVQSAPLRDSLEVNQEIKADDLKDELKDELENVKL